MFKQGAIVGCCCNLSNSRWIVILRASPIYALHLLFLATMLPIIAPDAQIVALVVLKEHRRWMSVADL